MAKYAKSEYKTWYERVMAGMIEDKSIPDETGTKTDAEPGNTTCPEER